MPARRNSIISLLLLFVLAFSAHSSPKIHPVAAAASATGRLVVLEGLYNPT